MDYDQEGALNQKIRKNYLCNLLLELLSVFKTSKYSFFITFPDK